MISAQKTSGTRRDGRRERAGARAPHACSWFLASCYNRRARAKAAMSRFKRVIGDGLRSRTDRHRATEVKVAVRALNRALELGRSIPVRIA